MMGRVGSVELAALGLGGSFMIFVFLVCLGIMMSLSPTIAQHFGAGRNEGIKSAFQQGLWLAAITSIAAFFLLREMGYLMYWIGVDPAIIPLVQDYLDLAAWSMPPFCFYLALRFLCEATGHSRPMLVINVATLPVVIVGNWALIFGHLGLPPLGVEGAAMNLVLVGTLNALGLLGFVLLAQRYRARRLFSSFPMPGRECLVLSKLGVPIAATLVLDSGFFSAIALMMGKMGHVWLAAHQVAINSRSCTVCEVRAIGRVRQDASVGVRKQKRRSKRALPGLLRRRVTMVAGTPCVGRADAIDRRAIIIVDGPVRRPIRGFLLWHCSPFLAAGTPTCRRDRIRIT